jgi:hypothetical protein
MSGSRSKDEVSQLGWPCPKCGEPMLKHGFAERGGPPQCPTYIKGEEDSVSSNQCDVVGGCPELRRLTRERDTWRGHYQDLLDDAASVREEMLRRDAERDRLRALLGEAARQIRADSGPCPIELTSRVGVLLTRIDFALSGAAVETTPITHRGEVMNPPESAAQGSEVGNLNMPQRHGLGGSPRGAEARPAEAPPLPELCDDCPPVGYPTDKTRCLPCPRRAVKASEPPCGHSGPGGTKLTESTCPHPHSDHK